MKIRIISVPLLVLSCLLASSCAEPVDKKEPSVLFIMLDDWRDWAGYSSAFSNVETPNIDSLARIGTVFANAHCAAPVCKPSRTALLTGLSPANTGVYSNPERWPNSIQEATTLTRHFMDQGYAVAGYGKIYHGQGRLKYWDEYVYGDYSPAPENPEHPDALGNRLYVADEDTGDGMRVTNAIRFLESRDTVEAPFFLACGLVRPHTPWDAPTEYFDRYPLDEIELPLVVENDLDDVPRIGRLMAGRSHHDRYHGNDNEWSHQAIVDADLWKVNLQAYLASITFADAQVGRLLDAWEKSPFSENGIVVLVGDHGWHHGEKSHWSKRTLWEVGTRTPMLVHAPQLSSSGDRSEAPVSLLDLYPTLVDLCGLDPVEGLDGVSLRPLLDNPDSVWERPAVTVYGKDNVALKTKHWRYIRYADGEEELYDQRSDPHELHNLAGRADHLERVQWFRERVPECVEPAPLSPGRESWFEEVGLR